MAQSVLAEMQKLLRDQAAPVSIPRHALEYAVNRSTGKRRLVLLPRGWIWGVNHPSPREQQAVQSDVVDVEQGTGKSQVGSAPARVSVPPAQ
jgi:hypothetical protein